MGVVRITEGGVLAQRFELREKLGEGGMGVVFRAWDRTLGKEVALKRMLEVGASQVQRLKSEFRARSALQHKNLVQLFELVIDGDDCFFTMELVDGTDLGSWVRRGGDAPAEASELRPTSRASGAPEPELEPEADTVTALEGRRGSSEGARVTVRSAEPSQGPAEPPLDRAALGRLRAALNELCNGLAVLHDASIVHRDVKPANVRVTPSGRVVLLDFGLAATLQQQKPGTVVAGTPRYMAPEQVRAEPTTAAADLYAVGGILYELVAGQGPFAGTVLSRQYSKAAGVLPRPILRGSSDDELAQLAMDLLAPDPASRPDARTVLRRLAGDGDAPSVSPTFGASAPGELIGRQTDLAALNRALGRLILEKRAVAVLVEGPSGIGKSTLLRRFVADVQRRDKTALVLTSRCNPQETVPFKALDAAMDALAEHASKVDGTSASLGPFDPALAHAALRLFPVLQSVSVLAAHAAHETLPDEVDMRAQGFLALRELFGRIAARGPLVLWIDDVQWDDADSVALLDALLRGRDAPPILLLLSMRTESRESGIVQRLEEPRPLVDVERLRLGPLGKREVAKLAANFLGEGDTRIAGVVSQSEGNPFLACELARYVAAGPPDSALGGATPNVVSLVAARLRELSFAERALLDVASLAVRPLTTARVIEAARLMADANTAVLALRDAFLVRQGSSSAGETIAPYHDKIAEATQRLMSPDARSAVHRSLAETIERHAPNDADALCVHWEGAGDSARAAACAYRAAEHAASTLAFDRAAELYEKAILLGFAGVEKALLLERAGAAHANHGRAPVAARRYLDASSALGDDVRSPRVRRLKRLAAEQYVESGYVRRGWEVMRSVLDAAGIKQPSSPARATVSALRRRLRFLARRIDIDAIGDRRIPESERPRLEILWTASTSMSMVNVTLSDAFRTQHLERILDVGDASSIARALAYEVALEAHVGGAFFDWHAARLLEHARRLVERTRDPYDAAWLQLGIANQAYCAGRFADAVVACRESERILHAHCSGVAWELTTIAAFLLTSLAMLGDLRALRESAERFTLDAERRGDLFGIAEGYSGECVLAWWSMGSGDDALARASKAVARQGGDAERWPEKTYRRGQLTELMAAVHLGLLAGDPWPAWRMMQEHWDGLKSAMIPNLQFYRSWLRHGRARVAIAAAERFGDTDRGNRDGWTRDRLLADARDMHRAMVKDKRPFGPPWSALIGGALAFAGGDRVAAQRSLEDAMAGFERAGMALYREAARYRLGELASRTSLRDEADAWLRGQGVPDPRALVDALAPGFSRSASS
jgi:serine/threonine protein kinase